MLIYPNRTNTNNNMMKDTDRSTDRGDSGRGAHISKNTHPVLAPTTCARAEYKLGAVSVFKKRRAGSAERRMVRRVCRSSGERALLDIMVYVRLEMWLGRASGRTVDGDVGFN